MSFLPTCAFNGRQSHFKSYITFTRIISAFNGRHPYFKSYLPFFKKLSVLSMPMEDSIFMQIFL